MKFLKPMMCLLTVMLTLAMVTGCDEQAAKDAVDKAGDTANEMGEKAGEMAEEGKEMAGEMAEKGKEMAEKGKEMAAELGEKAMAFIGPLKESLGNLEGLKDSPEELKAAVDKLLTTMEERSEDIKLPESISTGLTTLKDQLVALKDYLSGEYEQSEINRYVDAIMKTVKSSMNME